MAWLRLCPSSFRGVDAGVAHANRTRISLSQALATIVLAAGRSKRMMSALPKVLHPVLGLPLVTWVLDAAVQAGATRIVLVANPDNRANLEAALAEWQSGRNGSVEASVAVQTEPLGTAHAVLAARDALAGFTGTAVVLCGDAPCVQASSIQALLEEHRARRADLSVLSGKLADPTGYGRIVRGPDGDLAAIVEEKDATPETRQIAEINSGILALEMPLLWQILDAVQPSPKTGERYLTEAVTVARNTQRKTIAVSAAVPTDVLGVNDRVQLAEVSAVLQRRVNETFMRSGVTIVDPSSAFIDPRATIGRDATILPFVVIEGACKIGEGARVGPFAHVRGGSVVGDRGAVGNFVEVARSTMGTQARALHLAYLGDATLGDQVNVGAGTIVANFDGNEKHATKVAARASLGAGTVLVAPCEVGADAKTGAGAVVLARRAVPAGQTWAGVPAAPIKSAKPPKKLAPKAAPKKKATNGKKSASGSRRRTRGSR
jgi:bifunctional UDP-N-acetylglucosamine pyrophosphorylase/glucosamine-1-phosphate N-acetyltransferase